MMNEFEKPEFAEWYEQTFPLHTVASLSRRWGASIQAVAGRVKRDPDFPKPLTGILPTTPGAPKVFSAHDIGMYEKNKGLAVKS